MTRRKFLALSSWAFALSLTGCGQRSSAPNSSNGQAAHAAQASASSAPALVEIKLRGNCNPPQFDPIGLWVPLGQTVRWRAESQTHKLSAYHPDNGKELRIPEKARPWSVMLDAGCPEIPESFDYTFTVEGVYDYFCEMHEQMGMVGRIVVGEPKGPAKPLEQGIPKAAWALMPSVEQIMREKTVSVPKSC